MLPLFTTNSPLLDDRGHILAIICIGTDISQRKQAEEIMQKQLKELTQFNSVAVRRELRMVELKQEINALCAEAGQSPRYALPFLEGNDASH
jgi:predicted transcriptional regulator YheO